MHAERLASSDIGPVCLSAFVVNSGSRELGWTRLDSAGLVQEVGMRILEINCGMDRSGAKLMRLVSEATRSHRVAHASRKPVGALQIGIASRFYSKQSFGANMTCSVISRTSAFALVLFEVDCATAVQVSDASTWLQGP
jgi:hypothetical protein